MSDHNRQKQLPSEEMRELISELNHGNNVFIAGVSGEQIRKVSDYLVGGTVDDMVQLASSVAAMAPTSLPRLEFDQAEDGSLVAEVLTSWPVRKLSARIKFRNTEDSPTLCMEYSPDGNNREALFRATQSIHTVSETLCHFTTHKVHETLSSQDGTISFVFTPEENAYFNIQNVCSNIRDNLSFGQDRSTNIADYLSKELGLDNKSVELILKTFGDRLQGETFEEQVAPVDGKSFHPVLTVQTQDGIEQVCKLHYGNASKAETEQSSHHYLPNGGLRFIVHSPIVRPAVGSGVYLTFQDFVPEHLQAKREPTYYLKALAQMHLYGRQIMETAGVSVPRMQIPEFEELYQQVQFSSQGKSYVDLSRLGARHNQYEEARQMFEERGQEVLTHSDLFWKQLMGDYIGDTESLVLADDSFAFATWINDPDRPIDRGQAIAELKEYYSQFSREKGFLNGFNDFVARVDAATCIRDTLSLAWNSVNYDSINSPAKLSFVATRF